MESTKGGEGDTASNTNVFYLSGEKGLEISAEKEGMSGQKARGNMFDNEYIVNGFVDEGLEDAKLKKAKSEMMKNISSKKVELQSMPQ